MGLPAKVAVRLRAALDCLPGLVAGLALGSADCWVSSADLVAPVGCDLKDSSSASPAKVATSAAATLYMAVPLLRGRTLRRGYGGGGRPPCGVARWRRR